jgi:putative endonuclease
VADGAEIDLIVKKRNLIAFVEVKTRSISSLGKKEARPASSVNAEKQKKIIKAAGRYVGHRHKGVRKRFDIVEVYVDSSKRKTRVIEIKHLENTFNINTAYSKNNY